MRVRKTRAFKSFEEYENWTEQFENCCDYQNIPVIIDDGWKISADLFVDCYRWKTALILFEQAFAGFNDDLKSWIDDMKDCCTNGFFKDTTGWMPAWTTDPEEIKAYQNFGTYSWGVEEIDEGQWYIYLNISGQYAGREARTA